MILLQALRLLRLNFQLFLLQGLVLPLPLPILAQLQTLLQLPPQVLWKSLKSQLLYLAFQELLLQGLLGQDLMKNLAAPHSHSLLVKLLFLKSGLQSQELAQLLPQERYPALLEKGPLPRQLYPV